MKLFFNFLCVVVLSTFVFAACSKDDDPVNNDLFAGTYKGSVGFTNGSETKSNANGSVFVTKIGDRYDFKFSDDIPAITNVKMDKDENGYVGTVNGYTGVLRINANNLNIALTKEGDNWTANCNR